MIKNSFSLNEDPSLIGRKNKLFLSDLKKYEPILNEVIKKSSFLILGGAGSIGGAVVKELFKRGPGLLHVVDISENNLAELVRDLRSSYGYMDGEFKTFAIDIGSFIYDKFFEDFGRYDYVLNFSALKHVRSEKDPYTLMRMVETNILNTVKTLEQSIVKGVKKYFCVSTDKATNPVNLMGASKRVMELYLVKYGEQLSISTARFANVAFSDGSLLHSFMNRINKCQPIVTPNDVKRYFITFSEAGILCLLSAILGNNQELFFPKLDPEKDMVNLWEVAERFLRKIGYEPYICVSEEEARQLSGVLPREGKWACYISPTDTTGEKEYEEFYSDVDKVDWTRFDDIGVIKMNYLYEDKKLDLFLDRINEMILKKRWRREEILELFKEILPEFKYVDRGKFLDDKM